MGCKYACVCGGACWSCSTGQRESYFGEAEDLLSQQMGYRDYDDYIQSNQNPPEQEYPQELIDEYYANHPDNPKNANPHHKKRSNGEYTMKEESVRKGWCKHSVALIHDPVCKAGVKVREVTGGADFGWCMRVPCRTESGCSYKCIKYATPTAKEIQEHELKTKLNLEKMMEALMKVNERHPGKHNGGSGKIDCPACGKKLSYSKASNNGHIWGKCETENCLQWMM